MRILGLDHGEARIGLAISDDLGFLAHPLETLEVRKGDPRIRLKEIIEEKKVERLVIGLPYQTDGSKGNAVEKVERFIEGLRDFFPGLAIETVDERYTTVKAYERFREAGKNVKRAKKRIDQAAAALILQEYLDLRSAQMPDFELPESPHEDE